MVERLLADIVVGFHFLFIVFVVLGGLWVLRWRSVAWVHLPCVVWAAGIEFTGSICPLTPLENALRARAGDAGYAGGFIEHYLIPVIYPAGLTPGMQIAFGAFVLVLNAAIYWRAFRRRPARA